LSSSFFGLSLFPSGKDSYGAWRRRFRTFRFFSQIFGLFNSASGYPFLLRVYDLFRQDLAEPSPSSSSFTPLSQRSRLREELFPLSRYGSPSSRSNPSYFPMFGWCKVLPLWTLTFLAFPLPPRCGSPFPLPPLFPSRTLDRAVFFPLSPRLCVHLSSTLFFSMDSHFIDGICIARSSQKPTARAQMMFFPFSSSFLLGQSGFSCIRGAFSHRLYEAP